MVNHEQSYINYYASVLKSVEKCNQYSQLLAAARALDTDGDATQMSSKSLYSLCGVLQVQIDDSLERLGYRYFNDRWVKLPVYHLYTADEYPTISEQFAHHSWDVVTQRALSLIHQGHDIVIGIQPLRHGPVTEIYTWHKNKEEVAK